MSTPSAQKGPMVRFKRGIRCPVCGGSDDPKDPSKRCFGFIGRTGRTCYCTRPEHAGQAPFNAKANAFAHRLRGKCSCGTTHGEVIEAPKDNSPPARPKAEPQVLHEVYTALLAALSLDVHHRNALLARGFTPEHIDRCQFRSMPARGRVEIATQLARTFGKETLLGVPGFYERTPGGLLMIAGQVGLVLPIRGVDGLFTGIQIRPDKTEEGDRGKYRWLSSASRNGPSSGTPTHVPVGFSGSTKTVRFTEGAIKAELATAGTDLLTLAFPGVSLWPETLRVARQLGAKRIRLAFDADAKMKMDVATQLLLCAKAVTDAGLEVDLELWDLATAKGIDDLLALGRVPDLLSGDEALAALGAIASSANVSDPATLNPAAIESRIQQVADAGGAAGILRDKSLLAELARLKDAQPVEYAAIKANLKARLRNLSVRDFDQAVAANRTKAAPKPQDEAPTGALCAPGLEDNPHRLARMILGQSTGESGSDDVPVRFWRDEFHQWDGARYLRTPDSEMRSELSDLLNKEFERIYGLQLMEYGLRKERAAQGGGEGGGDRPKLIPVTMAIVSNVQQALAGMTLLKIRDCPRQPVWLMPGPPWPAIEMLAAKNALVHLPSLASGQPYSVAPTPLFFSPFALQYDFDPEAPKPVRWLDFLQKLWPNDPGMIELVQEWFGYCLTPDNSFQKILMLIGPKRSGKGTIARVLTAMIGQLNTVNPRLASLATNFGLSPLIGKSVAIITDARLSARADQAAIVESLLSISGEDDQTIDRKHRDAWEGRLLTRFMLISNELPKIRDASGALPSRMLMGRMTESFLGREDKKLLDSLLPELPGILLWSIQGWRRLHERGHFVQPESGKELAVQFETLCSPILAFISECCEVGPAYVIKRKDLFAAWKAWCNENGHDHPGNTASFGRDLRAAVPTLGDGRPDDGTTARPRCYEGIRLAPKPEAEPADPEIVAWLKA